MVPRPTESTRTSTPLPDTTLFRSVSSQVSQVPAGVGPPAQLRMVPLRLAWCSTRRPAPESNTSVVVPPAELGSYDAAAGRSEEHTSELQSLMRNSYAVFCLKKKKQRNRERKADRTIKRNIVE